MNWARNIKNKIIDFIKGAAHVIFTWLKTIWKLVFKLFVFMSSVVLVVLPFLNEHVELKLAQYIWYPLFVFWSIYVIKKRNIKEEKSTRETIRKWLVPGGLFLVLSVFVYRYYHIEYIWNWVVFGVVIVYSPLFLFSLFKDAFIENKQNETAQIVTKNFLMRVIQFWLYALTYMGIFNDWFWVTIIFGTLAVVLALYILTEAFLKSENTAIFFHVLNLLSALVASAYLIYIIPNDDFREIVCTMIAAVSGGIFTLVGVAWTIKKEADVRKEDLQRIADEQKEDERKRHIPYMKIVFTEAAHCEAHTFMNVALDLYNPHERAQLENNVFYQVLIQDFIVKNISESNIILKGIMFAEKYYIFTDSVILEKGELCRIRTSNNWSVILAKEEKTMNIVVNDILENEYSLECKLDYSPGMGRMQTIIDGETYTCLDFDCTVKNIKIPVIL